MCLLSPKWSFFKPPKKVSELTLHRRRRSSSGTGFFIDGDCIACHSFDPPLEILVFSAPAPKLLFFLVPPPEVFLLCMHGRHLSPSPRRCRKSKGRYETELKAFLKRPGAACSVKMPPDALLWHPSRGMASKGLCTLAGRDWADLLETAARADLTHRDP
ncbi:hypothetical protein F2Q69_00018331 [Brassica cretica]|uniref:Uncharacterized protein n=1 Tax=Brassica cretica TaxID=69181 RepID=A0A8S9QLK6_BRACR|nr:hypothetical protein F2Q69_00018331 [Brassica cretica]